MGKNNDYSRWRRWGMQGVMWLILGATVALAVWVSHEKRKASQVELGEAKVEGDLHIQLPKKWKITTAKEKTTLLLKAEEGKGRVLIVLRQRIGSLMSPLEYLSTAGLVDRNYLDEEKATHTSDWETIKVGKFDGILFMGVKQVPLLNRMVERKELLACAVLPSRQAITIKLEGLGRPDPSDYELLKQVADSIQVDKETPPTDHGGEVVLQGGTRIKIPENFWILPEKDENRIDRQLLLDSPMQQWMSVSLVPCLFHPEEKSEAWLGILSTRDPQWSKATVQTEGPSQWRIDLPATEGEEETLFPMRAYAMAGPKGQALVAIFRGGLRDGSLFETTWKAISKNVKFQEGASYETMLQTGAMEARRLRAAGLKSLLTNTKTDQWWLLYNEMPEHHVGWTHVKIELADVWRGLRETRWRIPGGAAILVRQKWGSSDDLAIYDCLTTTSKSVKDGGEDRFVERSKQVAILKDHVLTIALPKTVQPMPGNYLPAEWLPLILGRLADKPMILRSESFTGYEGIVSGELFWLLIEPTRDRPRTAEGEREPMRCLTVQVNGSGQISRWYFRKDGTLETIEFANGLRRVQTNEENLKTAFTEDDRLLP